MIATRIRFNEEEKTYMVQSAIASKGKHGEMEKYYKEFAKTKRGATITFKTFANNAYRLYAKTKKTSENDDITYENNLYVLRARGKFKLGLGNVEPSQKDIIDMIAKYNLEAKNPIVSYNRPVKVEVKKQYNISW